MQELELIVRPQAGEISCNFDDIEAALEVQMTAYAELEVTEDNIKERKADVATLRKIKKAIEDRCREVASEYDKPLVEFKARSKGLTGIIDKSIGHINEGLEAHEEARKAAKREHIKKLYADNIEGYEEYLPLEQIQSAKWENKTCSDNEIVSDIQEHKLRVRSDIEVIKGLNSEIEDKCIATYKQAGLQAAIAKNTSYLEAKQMAEARLRVEQEAKPEPVEPKPIEVKTEAKAEPVVLFEITGVENISEVRGYLEFNGIAFREVRA